MRRRHRRVACPLPAPDLRPWGASVVHTLTVGVDGWAMHEPLRTGGPRSAAVLDRVRAVGADADPAWFPTDGLVHLDLHTDNVLAGDDGIPRCGPLADFLRTQRMLPAPSPDKH